MDWVRSTTIKAEEVNERLLAWGTTPLSGRSTLAELAKRPEVSLLELAGPGGPFAGDGSPDLDALAAAEMEIKYAGYVAKERSRAERLRRQSAVSLPADLPYLELASLSMEARQKLDRVRPRSVGQAARIPGVAPSDLQNLMMEVRKAQSAQGAADPD